MFDFAKRLSELGDATVLCVGDLMLDTYVYGEVERISPEAPAPVLAVKREDVIVGGAGNVARNIAALGARCIFVGIVGDDLAGKTLEAAFAQQADLIQSRLVVDRTRPTTRKTRFVSEHHSTHLLRADWELARPVDGDIEAAVIATRHDRACRASGAVVLSDYSKGVLTPAVVRAVIEAARKPGKPVVVDPKYGDYSVYRGTTLITPNRKELAEATRMPADSEAELARAAAALLDMVDCEAALVTLSEHGMTLRRARAPGRACALLSGQGARRVRRRRYGGGDARGLSGGRRRLRGGDARPPTRRPPSWSASAAPRPCRCRSCARASCPPPRLRPSRRSCPTGRRSISGSRRGARTSLRIGFTNGCFDLLHPGHVKLLAEARAACDRLVVGLNSDASVKRLKGDGRPVQHQAARAEVLAALAAVDLVVLFDQDTPLELIRRVRPKVLVKGADYRRDQVVGREVVEADGGEVILVELVPGYSTSALVGRSPRRRKTEAARAAVSAMNAIFPYEWRTPSRRNSSATPAPAFSSRSVRTIRRHGRRRFTSSSSAGAASWSSRSRISRPRLRERRRATGLCGRCSAPENAGKSMTLHLAGGHSSFDPRLKVATVRPAGAVDVPLTTARSDPERQRGTRAVRFPRRSTWKDTRSRCCAGSISRAGGRG